MRHRVFTDRNGLRWTVSEVTKEAPAFVENRERRAEARSQSRRTTESTRLTTRPLESPWLSFESATGRRRVLNVPVGWDDLPEDELEDLLGDSELV
jgi:hypothetical protein